MTPASPAMRAPRPRCCSTPPSNRRPEKNYVLSTKYSAPARKHVRVDDVGRLPALVGEDLVEDVGELQLPLVARDVAEVGRADDVVHREQRMLAVHHRLVLVDVDRGLARTARP